MAHTPSTQAMRLPGALIASVLVVLLATTTPVGTGGGLHQLDLLHPLFSHVHLVNGRVLTHEQLAQENASAAAEQPGVAGPAIGAGSGASSDAAGVGLSPTLPGLTLALPRGIAWPRSTEAATIPAGRTEAPPDPPPPLS
jgi:hypothetical protein